jgi:hypothetical protein
MVQQAVAADNPAAGTSYRIEAPTGRRDCSLTARRWADPQPRSSGSRDKLANIHAYVTCDGAEKGRRDVSTLVERNGRHAAIRMSILAVRTTLPNLNESETGEDGGNLRGFRTGTSPII